MQSSRDYEANAKIDDRLQQTRNIYGVEKVEGEMKCENFHGIHLRGTPMTLIQTLEITYICHRLIEYLEVRFTKDESLRRV